MLGEPQESWVQRRVVRPFKDVVSSGASPHKLALSFAFGVAGGVFPVPGVTTLPVMAFVYVLGLNPAAALLINYLVTPLNLASMVPFIMFGQQLFAAEVVEVSLDELTGGFKEDPVGTLTNFAALLLQGILLWALCVPVIAGLVYGVMRPVTNRLVAQKSS